MCVKHIWNTRIFFFFLLGFQLKDASFYTHKLEALLGSITSNTGYLASPILRHYFHVRWQYVWETIESTIGLTWIYKVKARNWRNSSVVKSINCSCRGPEFWFEHLYHVAHHCLWLQLQRIRHLWPLPIAALTYTYPHVDRQTDTQLKMNLAKVKTNELVNIAIFTVQQEAIFRNVQSLYEQKNLMCLKT